MFVEISSFAGRQLHSGVAPISLASYPLQDKLSAITQLGRPLQSTYILKIAACRQNRCLPSLISFAGVDRLGHNRFRSRKRKAGFSGRTRFGKMRNKSYVACRLDVQSSFNESKAGELA